MAALSSALPSRSFVPSIMQKTFIKKPSWRFTPRSRSSKATNILELGFKGCRQPLSHDLSRKAATSRRFDRSGRLRIHAYHGREDTRLRGTQRRRCLGYCGYSKQRSARSDLPVLRRRVFNGRNRENRRRIECNYSNTPPSGKSQDQTAPEMRR